MCPLCAEGKPVHDTRDLPYTYKGESTAVSAVTGEFCPGCGEATLNAEESARVSATMLDFNKHVNERLHQPWAEGKQSGPAVPADLEAIRQQPRQNTAAAWAHYQATGLHATAEEADAWLSRLEAGQDGEFDGVLAVRQGREAEQLP